jgi:DNA polymerase-3 subunit gamma/tau
MTDAADATPYRVLARKYRPQTFAQLIGQDALVRTLTNAIKTGRLAHAFLLTGVRGVGKTTTARIIARAVNCIGPDGSGGPTIEPCGQCEPCTAIAADRHVDVMELDAASRTGVDDIREITDGVRYKPVSARFKVYIIDEVHMLSKNAFNALLKTLEEPPEHTKFVFATTEIRKVPVTVLSRCQRFDLRRIDAAELAQHLTDVAGREGAALTPDAAALLARAADGSVRDGLSLLDQAIALAANPAGGPIEPEPVRAMLGLADRALSFDLLEHLARGRIADALALYADMHQGGADALALTQDLLELTHLLTRLKVVPSAAAPDLLPEAARARAAALAGGLPMPALARLWQMLLKGIAEVQQAPDAKAALEMLMVRVAFVADLPSPADLVRRLQSGAPATSPAAGPVAAAPAAVPPGASPAAAAPGRPLRAELAGDIGVAGGAGGGAPALARRAEPMAAAPAARPAEPPKPDPQSFKDVIALFEARREPMLRTQLWANVHLVHFEPGRLEFRPEPAAPRDLASQVANRLSEWTGRRWVVAIASAGGAPTERDHAEQSASREREAAEGHPLIRAVLAAFPGASIQAVRGLTRAEADEPAAPAEPTDDDDDVADPT